MSDTPTLSPPPSTDSFGKALTKLSPWSSISSFFTNTFKIISGVVILVGACTTMLIGWWNQKVDKFVETRMDPYDRLVFGTTFVRDGKFDDAIFELEPVFDRMSRRMSDEKTARRMNWFLDNYLNAIAMSENPDKYLSQFTKVNDFLKNNALTPEPNHFHWMAMYHFRTGDLQSARLFFNKSLALSSAKQNSFYASDTRFALALVDMAEGNVNAACEELEAAARLDSRIWTRLNINLNDAWYARVKSLYQPKFENALFDIWDRYNPKKPAQQNSSLAGQQ
jgi:tetratricopeptide (TPR) repeat protein